MLFCELTCRQSVPSSAVNKPGGWPQQCEGSVRRAQCRYDSHFKADSPQFRGTRKRMIEERNVIKNLKCHNDVVKAFDSICVDVNKFDYALKYMNVLNNFCMKVGDSEKIIDVMRMTCSSIGKQYL
ncbi:hypothetical protein KIN20_011470 [Parelaphostrongylus tenuis]|uniref:Legumain prodomain domain-containing protein n=1 Tax=Parelaphostrongylus tenuis TaxID=148309 RepID=A0AAD5MVE4_PARTN|nr:hypothetical protein KIN20_011470 [Parelaphostrongylus tenuis]